MCRLIATDDIYIGGETEPQKEVSSLAESFARGLKTTKVTALRAITNF